MNENTVKLVESLAQKLGTTSEYTWGVLVKQAQINAWLSIFWLIVVCLMAVGLFKLHKFFMTPAFVGDEDYYTPLEEKGKLQKNYYDKYGVQNPMIAAAASSLLLLAIACGNFVYYFSAFWNPEYYAMNYITKAIE